MHWVCRQMSCGSDYWHTSVIVSPDLPERGPALPKGLHRHSVPFHLRHMEASWHQQDPRGPSGHLGGGQGTGPSDSQVTLCSGKAISL